MRRKHSDRLDSRITTRSVELFKLGRQMLAQGFAHNSTEFYEVSLGLHRALGLRPWHECIFDFEIFDMKPTPDREADFRLVQELHQRLVEAAA